MASEPGSVSITAWRGEVVAHVAEAAGRVEALLGVVGDDAARLLPAVLERVEAERHEARRLGHADHAEDAALLVQRVVARVRAPGVEVEGVGWGQVAHAVGRPDSVQGSCASHSVRGSPSRSVTDRFAEVMGRTTEVMPEFLGRPATVPQFRPAPVPRVAVSRPSAHRSMAAARAMKARPDPRTGPQVAISSS
jgi:hypothetical protein